MVLKIRYYHFDVMQKNRNRIYLDACVRTAREAKSEWISFGISVCLCYFCMGAPVLLDGRTAECRNQ